MRIILILTAIFLTGCTAQHWRNLATGLAASSNSNYPSSFAGNSQKLMIFGGKNHATYLGCLSCSEYDSESVFNSYGNYGSKYSANSIYNKYSSFGSKYSSYSPCNTYANDPPVIVDGQGNFYGRLTLNQYNSQATKDRNILAWLSSVCGIS